MLQVEASEIDRFYRALQRQAGLSAASVRHVHAILSKAMGQAVKWGWIPESPIPPDLAAAGAPQRGDPAGAGRRRPPPRGRP